MKESQLEMISMLELSHQVYHELIAHAKQRGIKFISTAFDLPSVDFLRNLECETFKTLFGEITNLTYLRHVGGCGKPIIILTGLSSLGEIENALKILGNSGTDREKSPFYTVQASIPRH